MDIKIGNEEEDNKELKNRKYRTSSKVNNKTVQQDSKNKSGVNNRYIEKSRKVKSNSGKMDIVTKMTIIGGLGLLCLLIIIGIVTMAIKDKASKGKPNTAGTEKTTEAVADEAGFIRALGLVRLANMPDGTLEIINIENNEAVELKLDGGIEIKDEYGSQLTLEQLKLGDIIETKYHKDSLRPEYVQITGQTWERKNIQNLQYNKENNTIQIGNDIFQYTEDMVCLYADEEYDFKLLDSVDLVSVKGYKDKVWMIELEKSHGVIKLKNHEAYIGGTIEVGKTIDEVKAVTQIKVLVGVQTVILNKDKMQPFTTEVIIEEGKEVVVDAGAALVTAGAVTFRLSPSNATLTVDGKVYKDHSAPITLDYGTHSVKADLKGYVTVEKQISVNKAQMTVDLKLNKTPMYIHVDQPAGAELYIDANYIGIIPVQSPIDAGNHNITLRKDGYYSKIHAIKVEDTGKDVYFTFPELVKMTENTTGN